MNTYKQNLKPITIDTPIGTEIVKRIKSERITKVYYTCTVPFYESIENIEYCRYGIFKNDLIKGKSDCCINCIQHVLFIDTDSDSKYPTRGLASFFGVV